jgi:starch-binding outer membrane protein, SusD/RagB family
LLDTRYVHGATLPTVSSPLGVLPLIEAERKKELVWRGLRWGDLKRYNKEGQNITLTRLLNGQTITLAPNDLRYVLPIPQYEINLSGIAQNPR